MARVTTANSGRPGTARRRRGRGDAALASRRREHLVRLAAGLFAEKGFQATTVRDIAKEAGILSGSLYHHFDSKESIVDELLTAYFAETTAAARAAVEAGEDAGATLTALVHAAFASLEPHRAAITVLQNDWNHLRSTARFAYVARSEAEIEALWVETIRRGQRDGQFRADLDPELTHRMIRDAVRAAVRWSGRGERTDAARLAEHHLGIILDGVHAR
jgi:AcrR family transcriptional regulator